MHRTMIAATLLAAGLAGTAAFAGPSHRTFHRSMNHRVAHAQQVESAQRPYALTGEAEVTETRWERVPSAVVGPRPHNGRFVWTRVAAD